MSCGDGNKPLDMLINSWKSWTNNQRWRLLVMIRLWWCFPGARNWLMSAAFRNGGAFSFLPPLPPASVKLFPSICYYPQKHLFTHFWDIFDTFLCVCLTHQRMLDKQWKWVLHVASIQRVPQHGKPITQIIQGGRRGRVIICFSGCLVVANHLGVGGAIRCWIREINYLCLAVSSELYQLGKRQQLNEVIILQLYLKMLISQLLYLINEDISSGLLVIFSGEASQALTRPLCAIPTKYCPAIL